MRLRMFSCIATRSLEDSGLAFIPPSFCALQGVLLTLHLWQGTPPVHFTFSTRQFSQAVLMRLRSASATGMRRLLPDGIKSPCDLGTNSFITSLSLCRAIAHFCAGIATANARIQTVKYFSMLSRDSAYLDIMFLFGQCDGRYTAPRPITGNCNGCPLMTHFCLSATAIL